MHCSKTISSPLTHLNNTNHRLCLTAAISNIHNGTDKFRTLLDETEKAQHHILFSITSSATTNRASGKESPDTKAKEAFREGCVRRRGKLERKKAVLRQMKESGIEIIRVLRVCIPVIHHKVN
jgi:hypothetical protein